MAQYIIEKMPEGMHGEGEKLFPKLVGRQVFCMDYIAEMLEKRTSFTRGDALGLLSEFAAIVEEIVTAGDTVKVDGLGVFRPVLGLVDKEQRDEWTDSANRLTTGRNVQLKTVNFSPESALLRHARANMRLVRASNRLGRKQPTTTVEERAAMARQYLEEEGFMHVADYAQLTGLARSTATKELRLLAQDETSGITSRGAGPGKVYVKREA